MVVVTELIQSRVHGEDSVDLVYYVSGTGDDSAAKTALLTVAPITYGSLVRRQPALEPDGVDGWRASVPYRLREKPETGDSSFSFDTGGGTQHITQSLQTISKTPRPGDPAAENKGAIGITHDNVEGVDITVPIYNFAETHYMATASVTGAYKGTLFALTGKVNSGAFRGFAAGEVLFLGASGSKRGEEDWEITFRFAASPNVTNLVIGDITVPSKKGWEYLWVRYVDTEDPVAHILIKQPQTAYVEKVYHDGDFTGLGIGT